MSEYLKWHKSTVGHTHMQDQAKNEIEQLREQLAKASEETLKLEQRLKSTEELLISSNDDLAKANARIDELEAKENLTILTTHEATLNSEYGKKWLNKFAIEKKAEAFEKYASMCEVFRTVPSIEGLRHHAEQLRKEK